MAQSDTHGQVV